jgi:hypothetical protein
MASELSNRLAEIADRGEWRGADTLMAAARTDLDRSWVSLSPERRRMPGWVAAVGAAALILVLIGGVALWRPVSPVITEVPTPSTTVPTSSTTVPAPISGPAIVTPLEIVGDDAFYTGHFPTLAFGPDGLPVVSYLVQRGPEEFSFKIARCADRGCRDYSSETEIPVGTWAQPHSLLISNDGSPVIAFIDDETPQPAQPGPPNMRVKVASCSDPACTTHTVVDLGPGQGVGLLAVEGDRLLVIYQSLVDPEVAENVAVLCSDFTCATPGDPSALPGETWDFGAHRAVTSDGLPVLAYTTADFATGQNTMNLYFCTDVACTAGRSQQVADAPLNSFVTGLALDDSDIPTVAFTAADGHEIYVTRCGDPACSRASTPMSVGGRQPFNQMSLAIDSDGLPLVAFAVGMEADTPSIRVARCADSTCSEGATVIVAEAANPWGVIMAMGPGAIPHLIYSDPPAGPTLLVCGDQSCRAGAGETVAWDQSTSIVAVEPIGEILEGWAPIPNEDGLFGPGGGGAIREMAGNDSVVVAVGSACELVGGSSDCRAAVWRAESAYEWILVPDPPQGDLSAVVAGGPGFIAAGSTCGMSDFGPDCAPAMWTSRDGTAWRRAPHDETVFASCAQSEDPFCQVSIFNLVANGDGSAVASGQDGLGAAVWRSTDGESWARAEFEGGPGDVWFNQLIATGSGFVLFGESCTDTGCETRAWTSTNGSVWQEYQGAERLPGYLLDVTTYDGKLYAVGGEGPAWVSSDGISWATLDLGVEFEGEGLVRIFSLRSQLIAAGMRYDEATGIEDGVFLTSADGSTWTAWAADPDVFPRFGINDGVEFDGVLIAGGAGAGGPALWVFEP